MLPWFNTAISLAARNEASVIITTYLAHFDIGSSRYIHARICNVGIGVWLGRKPHLPLSMHVSIKAPRGGYTTYCSLCVALLHISKCTIPSNIPLLPSLPPHCWPHMVRVPWWPSLWAMNLRTARVALEHQHMKCTYLVRQCLASQIHNHSAKQPIICFCR